MFRAGLSSFGDFLTGSEVWSFPVVGSWPVEFFSSESGVLQTSTRVFGSVASGSVGVGSSDSGLFPRIFFRVVSWLSIAGDGECGGSFSLVSSSSSLSLDASTISCVLDAGRVPLSRCVPSALFFMMSDVVLDDAREVAGRSVFSSCGT